MWRDVNHGTASLKNKDEEKETERLALVFCFNSQHVKYWYEGEESVNISSRLLSSFVLLLFFLIAKEKKLLIFTLLDNCALTITVYHFSFSFLFLFKRT